MIEDAFERRLAKIWFICAGAFAVALVLFLMRVDLHFTYSNAPQKADELLSEVRLAQTSLGSASIDVRSKVANVKEDISSLEEPHPTHAAVNKHAKADSKKSDH